MKAAVLHEIGSPFKVEEVDLLPPQPGEVRVRLGAAGLCHSDWHFVTGHFKRPLPLVLGHEGAGTVEEIGSGVTSVHPAMLSEILLSRKLLTQSFTLGKHW